MKNSQFFEMSIYKFGIAHKSFVKRFYLLGAKICNSFKNDCIK